MLFGIPNWNRNFLRPNHLDIFKPNINSSTVWDFSLSNHYFYCTNNSIFMAIIN